MCHEGKQRTQNSERWCLRESISLKKQSLKNVTHRSSQSIKLLRLKSGDEHCGLAG